jgi:hypothetical protein
MHISRMSSQFHSNQLYAGELDRTPFFARLVFAVVSVSARVRKRLFYVADPHHDAFQ